jgi:hypothetical protein
MFTDTDLKLLQAKGITAEQALSQLQRFTTGFPYLTLKGSATPGHGIMRLSPEQKAQATARWEKYLAQGGEACKFVPASGAASRMFKSLFAFVDGESSEPKAEVREVIDRIEQFAFYPALNDACQRLYGLDATGLRAAGRYKELIAAIIKEQGLNYGQLPKGMLQFHAYAGGAHTPVDEQISEGIATAVAPGGTLHLHFTVSPAHRGLFTDKLAAAIPAAEKAAGVKISATLSEQRSSTDTIAANPDGTAFRTADGNLLFRPGGHGALIENLGEIPQPVVFVKNIDNVVPDHLRASTVEWKKVLAGHLITVHDAIVGFLSEVDTCSEQRLQEMVTFLGDTLQTTDPAIATMDAPALRAYLRAKFNRPLRVCGMVVNEGEPGGGPYIAVNPDGSASPQILESHQIDPANADYKAMMAKATHFNPVDLVCYIQDPQGHTYPLRDHVDPATGFISQKSAAGRDLQALELPGLWNGAMSDWNTIFVEVPASTFNPVKTVNDLLRPTHQPQA